MSRLCFCTGWVFVFGRQQLAHIVARFRPRLVALAAAAIGAFFERVRSILPPMDHPESRWTVIYVTPGSTFLVDNVRIRT